MLVLAVAVISLDEIMAGRVETVDLHAVLPETGGLAAGAPVHIAGLAVGEVVSVTLLPPGAAGRDRVVARLRVPREHLVLLRRDSRARITTPGFVGDPLLDISPGTRATRRLVAGDTIPAQFGPDRAAEALVDARSLLSETDTLMTHLRTIGELYRERRPMIEEVSRSIDVAKLELERTRTAFGSGPLRAALGDARLGERIERVRTSLATLQRGIVRYSDGPLREKLGALDARADALADDLAVLDSLASQPAAFLGRLRADSALTLERTRTQAQMDSLVEAVRSDPFMFF